MSTVVIGLLDLEDVQRHYRQAVICALMGNEMAAQGQLDLADALLERELRVGERNRLGGRPRLAAAPTLRQQRQRVAWRIRKARRRQELKALSYIPSVA